MSDLSSYSYIILLGALVLAAMDWVAVAFHIKPLEYVFKPATMIAVLVAAWLTVQGPHSGWMAQFLIPGFLFALAGDIFLMLPGESFFLLGLMAFLLTQVCYVFGLNPTLPPWPSFAIAAVVAVIGVWLYRRIAASLHAQGQSALRVPVAVYAIALSLTLFSGWAGLFRPEWPASRQALVAAGTTLFFFSDATLAWNRFVSAMRWAPLAIIVTYHLAQLALAASLAGAG